MWLLLCGVQALGHTGFSSCSPQALGAQVHVLRQKGFVALWHVESSQIRDWTWVSCLGRQILYHWSTREACNHDYQGFPDSSVGKESACHAGDPSSIPGSGRSAGEGIGYPLQYSGLENSMNSIGLYSPWDCKESDMTERLSLKDNFIWRIL